MPSLLDYLGDRKEETLLFLTSDAATAAAGRLRQARTDQGLDDQLQIEASYDKVFIRRKAQPETPKGAPRGTRTRSR
jgi:hypothetical protein